MTETGIMASPPLRLGWLDVARGVAVIAMVIYHFAWDLSHFGLVETDIGLDPAWKRFAQAIAASFLAIAGVAQAVALRNGIDRLAFSKRMALVGGAALAVTGASYAAFPDRFIFFGILHCIALASVIGLAFRAAPFGLTLAAGLAVLALPLVLRAEAFNAPALIWLGLGTKVPLTNDFVPVFPWVGWFLAGLALGQRLRPVAAPSARRPSLIARLGRWSLPVYLIHQPVLFALFHAGAATGLLTLTPEVKTFVQSCTIDCETSGGAERVCLSACACAARTLRDRAVWPRVVSGETGGEDEAELTMVGRRCFEAAQ